MRNVGCVERKSNEDRWNKNAGWEIKKLKKGKSYKYLWILESDQM